MRNLNSFRCFVVGVLCLALSIGSPIIFADIPYSRTHSNSSCALTRTEFDSPPNINCISHYGCPPHRYTYWTLGSCSEPSELDCNDHLKYEWQRYSVKRYMYFYDDIPLSQEARAALAGAAACFLAGTAVTSIANGLIIAVICGATTYGLPALLDICTFYGCQMDWTGGSTSGPQTYSCL